jgi:GNAT superfamily N-acetyltransferase
MLIRPLHDPDIGAVASLMRVLAPEFILRDTPPEAASTFLRDNDACAVRRYVAAGVVYHVADVQGALAGFVAMRDCRHLFHMFVAKAHHGQGVGRALWEVASKAALDAGGDGVFTVNSSDYAIAVYRAFGFVPAAPRQRTNGLTYTPMQLTGAPRRHGAATDCSTSPPPHAH